MNKKNLSTFKSIFQKYDTDKTDNFEAAYEENFTPIRNDVKFLLEIGTNRGGSIRAWKEFFPNALIVGVDINPECYFEDDRIKIEIGSGSDPIFIEFLLKKYGNPDIIIDDGSHFSSDIKKSFELLYDKAKICYVIEDYGTQTTEYQNGFYINDGQSAINILHEAIKDLIFNNVFCKSIKIYYSICLIFK